MRRESDFWPAKSTKGARELNVTVGHLDTSKLLFEVKPKYINHQWSSPYCYVVVVVATAVVLTWAPPLSVQLG